MQEFQNSYRKHRTGRKDLFICAV